MTCNNILKSSQTSTLLTRTTVDWPASMASSVWELEKYNFYGVTLLTPYQTHVISTSEVDVFELFDTETLKKIKYSSDTFLLFDFFKEGTSYRWYNFYEILTASAKKHSVPFDKIIFGTSNLLENESYTEWRLANNISDKFRVLIFNFWGGQFVHTDVTKLSSSIDDAVTDIKKSNTKHFLSLNRRHRYYRTASIFELYKSTAFDSGLISFDRLSAEGAKQFEWITTHTLNRHVNYDLWNKFQAELPLVLDREDFETNLSFSFPIELYKKTLFSLVSETIIDETRDGTDLSLFYSEKTFTPMLFNHPVLIFGQRNCNLFLTKLGFRPYNKYFDLSFDNIINSYDRICSVIEEVERVCSLLNSFNLNQKIEWYLQDYETLEHNKTLLKFEDFNMTQLKLLLAELK